MCTASTGSAPPDTLPPLSPLPSPVDPPPLPPPSGTAAEGFMPISAAVLVPTPTIGPGGVIGSMYTPGGLPVTVIRFSSSLGTAQPRGVSAQAGLEPDGLDDRVPVRLAGQLQADGHGERERRPGRHSQGTPEVAHALVDVWRA